MKAEIKKEDLIELIHQTDGKIDKLLSKLQQQEQRIKDLEAQNSELKRNNQSTLTQIKDYIEELEQIRTHYADSNNNPGR